MSARSVPELAAAAAEKIRRDGWLQRQLYEAAGDVEESGGSLTPVENCAVCLLGACAWAYWGLDNLPHSAYVYNAVDDVYQRFLKAVAQEIKSRVPPDDTDFRFGPFSTITTYNDERAHAPVDVLTILDAVAFA